MKKILIALFIAPLVSAGFLLADSSDVAAHHTSQHCIEQVGSDNNADYDACVSNAPSTRSEQSAWCEENRSDSEFESCMLNVFGVDVTATSGGSDDSDNSSGDGSGSGGGITTQQGCDGSGSFLGFPTWHRYLQHEQFNDPLISGVTSCNPVINSASDIWLIVAAVIEILLRVAALISVGFIVYGGALYIISQSQPDKVSQALKTTINAVIGLIIAISASAVVSFVANRLG